ncbi:hypothetical protein NHP190003_16170 (plasmid) [Helicobacter sp. NHP19-003]|uniref:AAA+ ATPase domain-containing protein n=1 Tax=Helicobacter gastrocanis TaxID=2849641 RepID=A0ABN6I424_9HELI|nr:AAA family ATPase [Helicobacter sp. NHP19-003]BCZ18335.1 hypothetical protein NHP190003_16170 [Helicobacter sp. NHP19-003]
MQKFIEMGYYELQEFLIRKGVRYDLAKRISKRIFKNGGKLPKNYALDFVKEHEAYAKTLLKKQGRKLGDEAWDFPKLGEEREVQKLDFSQIAQDCGEYWFFPQICQERQSIEPKQLFANSAQIEKFIRGCFSFSKQICDHVAQHYLKSNYGGLFGDFKISFEAFKQDLLKTFKGNDFELCKAFCKLQPYCVDGDLVFAITPNASTPKVSLPRESTDQFLKFLEEQEKKDKAILKCLIGILYKKPLGFTPSHQEKRLTRLHLERDCGLLKLAHTPTIEEDLKNANIAFLSVFNSDTHHYYFPVAFRLWALARLKDLLKKSELRSTLETLYDRLEYPQRFILTHLHEIKRRALWSYVHDLLSHLQLPLRVVAQKETWQVEKVSNFFPLALSLNQKPTPIHEIRTLLVLDNPKINKDSLSTQKEQPPSMLETPQKEPTTQEELDEWEYQQYEAFSKEQTKLLYKMLEEGIDPFEYEPQTSYTPEALYKYLDCVSGQEEAKKALCVTLSDHYARFNGNPCMPKTNMLLIGPSGSGKTFMTTTLLKKLDIPYYIADASNLTPTGWKGEELMSIFVGLYVSAGKDIEKAQKGVIFLDEVDKLGMEVTDNQFKSLVQTELLKPMEGHAVTFAYDKQDITLKTDEILFIFAGHFKDLYASLNTTIQPKNSIGFTNTKPTLPSTTSKEVSSQDLQRCGLFREFIGRIGNVVVLEPVDHKMLSNAIDNESKPFKDNFREHGSILEIDEGAKEVIIEKAMQEGTGMRAIKTLLSRVIHTLRFSMEKWQDHKCIITAETITNKKEPMKIPLNISKENG